VAPGRTHARREVLHCHRQAVTTSTRARNRLKSFLSDQHVRLKMGIRLTEPSGAAKVQASASWTPLPREFLAALALDGPLQRQCFGLYFRQLPYLFGDHMKSTLQYLLLSILPPGGL
jgi:hypothetical protein